MTQEERFGSRDRTYSAWHRRMSMRRFVGMERAQLAAMIDLDASLYVEYDDGTKEPLALIETAKDIGQGYKVATVTRKLAERAQLLAYVVLYTPAPFTNPADSDWPDIQQFRVQQIFPRCERGFRVYAPNEWADLLIRLRDYAAKRLDDRLDGELPLAFARHEQWSHLKAEGDRQFGGT